MAKESDAGTHDIQVAEVYEDVNFSDTFTAIPVVVVMYNQITMEKLSIENVTTVDFDLWGKKTGFAGWIALEAGFDDADPQTDAGVYTTLITKTWEPVVFGGIFDTIPEVAVTASGSAAGKKAGAQNITTTGFDIYSEDAGGQTINWIAREKEFS